VPNETLITTRVENASLADTRVLVQTGVQVAYGTDVRSLQPKLEAAVAAVPRVIADPKPSVLLEAFSADGMDLRINFWIGDSENGTGNVKSTVNLVGPRPARSRERRDPVPAARRARHRLDRETAGRRGQGPFDRGRLTCPAATSLGQGAQVQVERAHVDVAHRAQRSKGHHRLTALPSGRLPVFIIAANDSGVG
jgi:hypothetical protein